MFRLTPRLILSRTLTTTRRTFITTHHLNAKSENSTPGWSGRPGTDHVLHRDGKDAQSAPSQEARKDKEQGKEGSGAVSQKDERDANQRAKEEHPEAPGPVIGMNSERGGKY